MSIDKKELVKGIKYELAALPLLLIAPIIITIGYKAINLEQNYCWIILGILMAVIAIGLGFIGIRIILNALFNDH